jgi:hypothetical protein
MEPTEFLVNHPNEDGWCDWQLPHMRGYLMKCCDCGLVHEVEFNAVQVTGENEIGPLGHTLPIDQYRVQLRMRRPT